MVMQRQPIGYTEDYPLDANGFPITPRGGPSILGPTGTPSTQTSGTPLGAPVALAAQSGTGTTPTTDPVTGMPLDPMAGLAPYTGFASRYTPAMAEELIWENPWYILQDVFSGVGANNPFMQALRDLGGDPLTLFNITQGGNRNASDSLGAGDFINWLENMYRERSTRGGATFDGDALLNQIFSQTPSSAEDGSSNVLSSILGAGGPSEQVRILFNMLRDVSNVSMNPLQARGYQSAVARAGDEYGNAALKAEGDEGMLSPTEWIAQNMPWLAGGR